METKKNFMMPQIDVVHFDVQDVITASLTEEPNASVFQGIYDVTSGWKNF